MRIRSTTLESDITTSRALLKRYMIVCTVLIAAFAIADGLIVSSFLINNLLKREGQTNAEYIRRVLSVEDAARFFEEMDKSSARIKLDHVGALFGVGGDVIRANAYNKSGEIIWSTNRELIGRRFSENSELTKALEGELVIHTGKFRAYGNKSEHEGLNAIGSHFVETYVPILSENNQLVGVIESYRIPSTLDAMIEAAHLQAWTLSLAGATLLCLALLGFAVRTGRTIRHQEVLLAGSEAMLATNEAASAMAHNIRNPLASIRSSAELAHSVHGEIVADHCGAIIRAVDRIERWIRELMQLSAEPVIAMEKIPLRQVLAGVVADIAVDVRKRSMKVSVDYGQRDIYVHNDSVVFVQVMRGVISNAIEASQSGDKLDIKIESNGRSSVVVSVQDFGAGINDEDMKSVFRPFFSTKKNGMGMGLFLAKRALERTGGLIRISSRSGAGTRVEIELRVAP